MTTTSGVDRWVLGIDIGGTKIAAALVAEDGRIEQALRHLTPVKDGMQAVARTVTSMAADLLAKASLMGVQPVGVGIGTGGQVDTMAARVVGATALLPDLAGYPLGEAVRQAVDLPVWVENDAKAMARAELRWGVARDAQDVVFLTLGTGIGGAVAVRGRVVDGARGFAGHIGHVVVEPNGPRCSCGARGCMEALASASGILRTARRLGGSKAAGVGEATDVYRLASDGVDWAQRAMGEATAALGQGVSGLIHVLNPELIVIGGGLAAWGEPWRERIEGAVNERVMAPFRGTFAIRLARYGPSAGVAGAGALALERASEPPE